MPARMPLTDDLFDTQSGLRARNIQRDLIAPDAQFIEQLRVLIKQTLEFYARSAGISLQSRGKRLEFLCIQMGKQTMDVALQ
ncbi:hypothetical protein D3C78_1751460 [compost metagenome]